MIVVDTNVIAYLLLQGEHNQQAEVVFSTDSEWVAPYLWRSEFRSVLTLYIRQGYVSLDDAKQIIQAAEVLMQGKEYETQSKQILDLIQVSTDSSRCGNEFRIRVLKCSAYDCEYVALAQQLRVKLVTGDRKILSEFPSTAISMASFAST